MPPTDTAASKCSNAECRKPLQPPLLQCARCKAATYCSKSCQTKAWKTGHKRECLTPREKAEQTRRAMEQATRLTAQLEPTAHQIRLVNTLHDLVDANDWKGGLLLEEEAMAVAKELRGIDLDCAERIYTFLGVCYDNLGEFAKALPLHVLCKEVAEEQNNAEALGRACNNLGSCYQSMGKYEQAIDLLKQGKAIAEEHEDRAGIANACGNLALCYQGMGEYGVALEMHGEHVAIAQAMGDRAGIGKACGNQGNCYQRKGHLDKAIALLEESKAIAEEFGDRAGAGAQCTNLGICYERMGDFGKAVPLFEEGMAIAKEVGHQEAVCTSYGSLASCFTSLGRYGEAESYFKTQYAISSELEIEDMQSSAALGLGVALCLQFRAERKIIAAGVSSQAHSTSSPASVQGFQPRENLRGEALAWLKMAQDLGEVSAQLYIAYISFDSGWHEQALRLVKQYLSIWLQLGRYTCLGCGQNRGDNAPMLTCGGCGVAKFCSADCQKFASKSAIAGGNIFTGRHKDSCALLRKWRQVVKEEVPEDSCDSDLLAFLKSGR